MKKKASSKSVITVRLDPELERQLDDVSEELGQSRSEVIRDVLRRQLTLLTFRRHRQDVLPFAEAQGYLTDEDILPDIS